MHKHTPHFIFNYGATHGTTRSWVFFIQRVKEITGQDVVYDMENNVLLTKKKIKKAEGNSLWWYCQGLWEGGFFGNTI
jgi:hypothetical protein